MQCAGPAADGEGPRVVLSSVRDDATSKTLHNTITCLLALYCCASLLRCCVSVQACLGGLLWCSVGGWWPAAYLNVKSVAADTHASNRIELIRLKDPRRRVFGALVR